MTGWRVLLGVTGLVCLGWGVAGVLSDVPQLPQLVIWLAVAVGVHEGLLVPVELATGAILWRASARLPRSVGQVITGGVVVSAILTLLAVPLTIRQPVEPNPSALAQPYGRNLALLVSITAVVTVALAVIAWKRDREPVDLLDHRIGRIRRRRRRA
ncbi:hypothetical protein FB566_3901 [Stackebrandtia endophytica]|uniref:Uncharacterized protein n=1 Tax=Stackebrandtia endophytica TaxID=1496996 RepID=A0A543B0G8_9ACTN|nr:hypothetical protein [Stackebrandtia endophytica]TQL78318.1 hypothetical protein FB566_3901 [Stackebrandtia endophytica]